MTEEEMKSKITQAHTDGYNRGLAKARTLILMLYNAGRDVLMCRNEEKAYENLDVAINDKRIEQFLEKVK